MLLVAYIVFIVISMSRFKNRIDIALDYPVRVTQETREIKTRILEMKNSMPGLLSSPNKSLESKMAILDTMEKLQGHSFDRVKKYFIGDTALLDTAEKALTRIWELRREAVMALAHNADFDRAMEYYNARLTPAVKQVYNSINAIYGSANQLMENARHTVDDDARRNVILTVAFGVLLSLAFFYADRRDRLRVRELASRERLFSQLSSNVNEVFIISRGPDKFEYVTTNSESLIGLPCAEIVSNPQTFYNFLDGDRAEWLAARLDQNRPERHSEDDQATFAIGDRTFKIALFPILEDGHDTGRTLVGLRDETETFRQQKVMSEALDSANAASEAKSKFLSHMSHEIRTPMNVIIGMTTIALSRLGDRDRVEDCLCKISESSRHLLGLINDVLDMSKIENGKLSINRETFNLERIVQNIRTIVAPQAAARKLDFDILLSHVDEENIVGDALRLNQILLNILSNAIKFTSAGGRVVMKIEQVMKAQSNVVMRFIISDTGIGMSQEFLERIYRPFEQESSKTAVRYGGTGLGMSITFNLVKLMGGTICVSSREGEGSVFTVELPFGLGKDTARSVGSLPPLRVLVVDDDEGTCEHASLLLEKMGLHVSWKLGGEDAVKEVVRARDEGKGYDICLIDWKMPGMDGEETSRRIRQSVGDDMLIIIISAYDWSPIEERARAAGVNDFIAKPFFASSLYDTILSSTKRISEAVEKPEEEEHFDFSGLRILLAEDNEFNMEIADEFLSMVNASVEHAGNGKEALEKFLKAPEGYFDLVLMDVQMPLVDGYEATRKIRASDHPDARDIPILAMTANAFSEDVANAVAAGMNGHIAKPIDVRLLYRLIAAHTGRSAGGRAG